MVEAGRQWANDSENQMLSGGNMEHIKGLSQLYLCRNIADRIIVVIEKLTDEFTNGGSQIDIMQFIKVSRQISSMKSNFAQNFLFQRLGNLVRRERSFHIY